MAPEASRAPRGHAAWETGSWINCISHGRAVPRPPLASADCLTSDACLISSRMQLNEGETDKAVISTSPPSFSCNSSRCGFGIWKIRCASRRQKVSYTRWMRRLRCIDGRGNWLIWVMHFPRESCSSSLCVWHLKELVSKGTVERQERRVSMPCMRIYQVCEGMRRRRR